MDEQEIYREIILDHRNNPRGKATGDAYDFSYAGHMPECMDELIFCGNWDDEILKDFHYRGVGCPVSTASVSLLCAWGSGKSRRDLKDGLDQFLTMMNDSEIEPNATVLGDAVALSAVREFSSRSKCAVFPWQTFLQYLEE